MKKSRHISTIFLRLDQTASTRKGQKIVSFFLLRGWILWHFLFLSGGLNGQSGNVQFFDEKYSLLKGVHYIIDDTLMHLTQERSFEILKTVGDTLVIRFELNDSTDDVIKPDSKLFFGDGYDARVKFTDWDIRPLTIPIKLRPKILTSPLQFEADVAIGPYFGYEFGSMRYAEQGVRTASGTAALFCTPSLIDLDENNNDSKATDNVLGITLGGGFLLNVNENQFGIVCGWDYVGGNPSLSWSYQGRFWTSVSMGFKIND